MYDERAITVGGAGRTVSGIAKAAPKLEALFALPSRTDFGPDKGFVTPSVACFFVRRPKRALRHFYDPMEMLYNIICILYGTKIIPSNSYFNKVFSDIILNKRHMFLWSIEGAKLEHRK